MRRFLEELSTDIDVCGRRVHSAARYKASLNQLVRVTSQNLTVLAGSRLSFIRVDDEIARSKGNKKLHRRIGDNNGPRVLLPSRLVHKTPLQSTRETRTSTTPKTRVLDGVNDPRIALENDIFCFMPITTGLRTAIRPGKP